MNCPICNKPVAAQALECRECGESLTTWRTLQASTAQVRERGLQQAARGDFLGAMLSFLEAAFASPLQMDSWLDAARALVRLGQVDDAVRLLEFVRRRAPQSDAAGLIDAIRQLTREAAEQQQSPAAAAAVVPEGNGHGGMSPQAVDGASTPGTPPAKPRPLLGLPPLLRKRSFLQRFAGGASDPLWESVLAVEARSDAAAIEGGAWLRQLAQHDSPHAAVLYMLGLGSWQTQDPAGAMQWFLRTVQLGSPYLNPVGYVLCCTAGQSRQLSDTLRVLRDFGIQTDEVQQVVQELRNRGGDGLRPEMVQHLQAVEQINVSI